MLTLHQKNQIKYILQDSRWKIIEDFADELCRKIKSNTVIGENQWETIKNLLLQEGEVRGIKRFIKELYRNVE